jgi:hypothetical protein
VVHVAELVEDGGEALFGHGGWVVAPLELVGLGVGKVQGPRHCAGHDGGWRVLLALPLCSVRLLCLSYSRAEEKRTRASSSCSFTVEKVGEVSVTN